MKRGSMNPTLSTAVLLLLSCTAWTASATIPEEKPAAKPPHHRRHQLPLQKHQDPSKHAQEHASSTTQLLKHPQQQQEQEQEQHQDDQQAPNQQHQQHTPARFFIDEGYFMEGETEILRGYIAASEGRLHISGESTAAFLSVKGYYIPDKWDVYFSIRQACHMAFKHMKPGQRANCVPGVHAITLKKDFVQSWQQAYGELAFGHIPRSYKLPEQYWVWRSHMLQAQLPPETKWVLKANIHRGKGVSVLPQQEAVSRALERAEGTDGYRHVLVQSYLHPQMVIQGRSSYLRVWLLVTSVSPLRAYLFKGGFAVFGKQRSSAGAGNANSSSKSSGGTSGGADGAATGAGNRTSDTSGGGGSDGLIVNLWIQDREKSPIWSLAQLGAYLDAHPEIVDPVPLEPLQPNGTPESSSSAGGGGARGRKRTFADAWADMRASASLVLAAGLASMRAAAANASAPPNGPFEYFGLDFVLDSALRPRMLEVNAVPSMARRQHSGCAGPKSTSDCKLVTPGPGSSGNSSGGSGGSSLLDGFDEQKEVFVHDMLKILGLPVDRPSREPAGGGSGTASAALRRASVALGGGKGVGDETVSGNGAGGSAAGASGAATGVGDAQRRRWKSRNRRNWRRRLAESAESVPEPLRALLCGGGEAEAGAAAGGGGEFGCVRCLTAGDLTVLADVESELENVGRFVPVHDLMLAHRLNEVAAEADTAGSVDAATGGAPTDGGSSGSGGGGGSMDEAVAAARSRVRATYLENDAGVWQKLYRTWKTLTDQGVPVRDLEVMQYFTTDSKLPAAKPLQLDRTDYIMSAWLRAREEAEGDATLMAACNGRTAEQQLGGVDPCLVATLKRLVSHCYL